jgi:hypothetical protein
MTTGFAKHPESVAAAAPAGSMTTDPAGKN